MTVLFAQSERPSKFSEVVGDEVNSRVLLSIAKDPSNTPHVLILSGSYGCGKTTSARLLYRAMNCTNFINGKSRDVCGTCPNCLLKHDQLRYLHEYDSSTINKKDGILKIRDTFSYGTGGNWGVYIFDECHLLSHEVQSALLKVFEENVGRNKYVLCTTDPDYVLPTIRSRSIELTYTQKSMQQVETALRKCADKHGLELSDDAYRIIAQRSNGGMRDAYMLLQKYTLIGKDLFVSEMTNFEDGMSLFMRTLVTYNKKKVPPKQDLVNSLMTKLLSMPVATFRIEYQSYLNQMMHYAMFHDEAKVSKSVSRLVTQLEGFGMMNLHMLVRYCVQNWVIDGFRDDMGTQNVLLALISGAADMEMVS